MLKIIHWIDDEISELRPTIRQFEKRGIIVKTYSNWNDFNDNYQIYPYEIIIVDYFLGSHQDGFDILKNIRSRLIKSPIIIHSGMLNIAATRNLFLNGADDVIEKSDYKTFIEIVTDKLDSLNKANNCKDIVEIANSFSEKEKLVFETITKKLSDEEALYYTGLGFSNLRKYKRKIFDKFRSKGYEVKSSRDICNRFNL